VASGLVLGALLAPVEAASQAVTRATRDEIQLIMELEDSLWATSRDRRIDAFATYLAPGYRGVYPDGIHDKSRELATFADVKIRTYQLNDLLVRPLGPGLYAVTYRATVRGNYLGYDLQGDYWCATVWQGSRDSWQAVLHTETKAPQK
jgi:hypothetical protein